MAGTSPAMTERADQEAHQSLILADMEHLFCGVSLSSGDAALIADGSRPRRLPPEPEGLPGYFRLSTVGPSSFEAGGSARCQRQL